MINLVDLANLTKLVKYKSVVQPLCCPDQAIKRSEFYIPTGTLEVV